MEVVPEHVAFLAENRRQHGVMADISSDICYDGNMRSIWDPDYPTRLAYAWHVFGQESIRETRSLLKNGKDVNEGKVAENLHGNRVTLLCTSSRWYSSSKETTYTDLLCPSIPLVYMLPYT